MLLDASRSTDVGGRIIEFLWDLNGDGVFERNTGAVPRVRHAFHRPGKVRVAVIVVDQKGARDIGYAKLRALPAHRDRPRHHAVTRHAKRKATARKHSRPKPTILFAANSGSVTIKNYAFSPKSLTIKVGDTVTWTNRDKVGHSATADDGTFDTGVLGKGATGSFRFTKAGTYAYHCTPHPFMKASVKVTGSSGGSSGGSSSGSNGGSSGSSGSRSSSSGSSLPHTGLPLGGAAPIRLRTYHPPVG